MITLQSDEIDKIIVTDTTPTPPTPVDPVDPPNPPDPVDPEEEVGVISVIYNAMDGSNIDERIIPIKRNMLGTSVEFSPDAGVGIETSDINSFTVTPSTVQVTQIRGDTLSVQIPTELLEEVIELVITLAIYGR